MINYCHSSNLFSVFHWFYDPLPRLLWTKFYLIFIWILLLANCLKCCGKLTLSQMWHRVSSAKSVFQNPFGKWQIFNVFSMLCKCSSSRTCVNLSINNDSFIYCYWLLLQTLSNQATASFLSSIYSIPTLLSFYLLFPLLLLLLFLIFFLIATIIVIILLLFLLFIVISITFFSLRRSQFPFE